MNDDHLEAQILEYQAWHILRFDDYKMHHICYTGNELMEYMGDLQTGRQSRTISPEIIND